MIDLETFNSTWAHLCDRFGRDADPRQARSYYQFLSEQMETEPFVRAARAIWATAKWFPRPADFLLLEAHGEWRTVLRAAEGYTPPHGDWHEHWKELTPRARAACECIGGIDSIRKLYERDVLRLKEAYERAYEQETAEAVLVLPARKVARQLRSTP